MRRTRIVATLGPATDRPGVLREVIAAGVDVVRLNASHSTREELKRRLDAGEPIVILDLRHAIEIEADSMVIPGSLHIPAEELEARLHEIPRDAEIVLACS